METLRAWERRHDAVTPGRDSAGRRVYSDRDLRRIELLARLGRSGYAIGRICRLPTAELVRVDAQTSPEKRDMEILGASLRRRVWSAAETYDIDQCGALVGTALVAMTPIDAVRQVLSPIMREVGERWECGAISVADEHFVSETVKRLLQSVIEIFRRGGGGPIIAFGTLAGERHEVGCLFAAYLAAARGFRCCYLGPDIPAKDFAGAVHRSGARAVGIGVTHQPKGTDPRGELSTFCHHLPAGIEVWIGGAETSNLKGQGLPARCLDMDDLGTYARRLDSIRHGKSQTG